MRCNPSSPIMDVATELMLTTKERRCLDVSELGHMRVVTYIPCDKYFLITLIEHCYDNTNIFHLLMGEITIILVDIYRILWVPMKRTLIQRATLSMDEMEEHYHWLTCV